jgi:hypothetical protein
MLVTMALKTRFKTVDDLENSLFSVHEDNFYKTLIITNNSYIACRCRCNVLIFIHSIDEDRFVD